MFRKRRQSEQGCLKSEITGNFLYEKRIDSRSVVWTTPSNPLTPATVPLTPVQRESGSLVRVACPYLCAAKDFWHSELGDVNRFHSFFEGKIFGLKKYSVGANVRSALVASQSTVFDQEGSEDEAPLYPTHTLNQD
jgi:hypothetical protein